MKYNEVLRNLRLESGKQIKQVAEDLDISANMFGKYELGEYEPSIDKIIKFADYYGVSTDFLLKGEDKKGVYISQEEYNELKIAKKAFDNVVMCLDQIESRQNAINNPTINANNNTGTIIIGNNNSVSKKE